MFLNENFKSLNMKYKDHVFYNKMKLDIPKINTIVKRNKFPILVHKSLNMLY